MANWDSAADRLAAVRNAIYANTLNAQSYSAAGRSKAMASLGELRKLEKELQDEVSQSGSGSMCGIISNGRESYR